MLVQSVEIRANPSSDHINILAKSIGSNILLYLILEEGTYNEYVFGISTTLTYIESRCSLHTYYMSDSYSENIDEKEFTYEHYEHINYFADHTNKGLYALRYK